METSSLNPVGGPLQRLKEWKSSQPAEGSLAELSLNRGLLSSSLKNSTRKQYAVPVKYYLTIASFPATVSRLQAFMRALAALGYPSSTIRKYVSAISSENVLQGFPALLREEQAVIRRSLRGIDHIATTTSPPRQAPRISDDAIKALIALPTTASSEKYVVRGVALTAIALVCRLSEILHLRADDISPSSSSTTASLVYSICLRDTKTKAVVFKECACSSSTASSCPSRFCVLHFLVQMQARVQLRGPLFPALSQSSFMSKLKKLLIREYPAQADNWRVSTWSYHSFRVTGACRLKDLGYQDSDIQFAGHWASDSWRRYISSQQSLSARDQSHVILSL